MRFRDLEPVAEVEGHWNDPKCVLEEFKEFGAARRYGLVAPHGPSEEDGRAASPAPSPEMEIIRGASPSAP